jgi:hypothetical protein
MQSLFSFAVLIPWQWCTCMSDMMYGVQQLSFSFHCLVHVWLGACLAEEFELASAVPAVRLLCR